jgi:hypothetical protein
MRVHFAGVASSLGVLGLALGFSVSAPAAASAVPTNAVSFACFNTAIAGCPVASFNGYATGSEVHLSALTEGSTTVANLDQGFSGASTASAGLTKAIVSETTSVVQPAQASAATKAYGSGSGLEIGLGTDTLSQTDQNQIQVAGRAEQVAPPNGPAKTADISIPGSPVIDASLLKGEGAAVYDNQVCPIGQPISYGLGNAAGVGALIVNGTPTLTTSGTGTSAAQSTSQTYLAPNGDGSFGLSSAASDIIAPVSVNLPGGLQLAVAVQSAGNVDSPVTLTAKTTGESTGAAVTFSSDDILKVDLVSPAGTTNIITIPLSSIGKGGLHIPLSTSNSALAVGSTISGVLGQPQLQGFLNQIGTTISEISAQTAVISLGSIDVDTYPHVIGAAATVPAVPVGGTSASGALDLLHLNLALSGTLPGDTAIPTVQVADFFAGHLQTAAALTAPILCNLPVIKSANPTSVVAGNSFDYDIQVPDPAKLDLIDCNLDNITVTDTITDWQGTPSFTVTSAKDTATGALGTIQTVSPHEAVVTWTGLSYKLAATGQPPNAPIPLDITVSVPSTSTAGVIMDVVQATATANSCQGGAAGSASASAGAANGVTLTGSFTLHQPSVAALGTTAVTPASAKALPFTGAMGGLWQPVGGLGALALGGGTLFLVRRSRQISRR